MTEAIESIIAHGREAIADLLARRRERRLPKRPGTKIARTIAFTSGKGGVGKTNLVANVAIALAQTGLRVIILDGDLGLANIDVVFGIRPQHSILEVIDGRRSIEDVLVKGPKGVEIVPGASGIKELAALDATQSRRFLEQMRFLEARADVLLIDTGAGIAPGVVNFCLAADEVVVVTNPEPTAMADAYGIIKIVVLSRPDARIGLLVNRVADATEGRDVFTRLQRVSADFLQFRLRDLGWVTADPQLQRAVCQQTPLLLFAPLSPAARDIRDRLAGRLAAIEHAGDSGGAPDESAARDESITTGDEATEAAIDEGFFARLARHLGRRTA